MLTARLISVVALSSVVLIATVINSAPAGAAPAQAPPPAGGISLRLVDIPVNAKNDPRARLYIVDHLAPGTVIHRRVEVRNTTTAAAHVVLYPAAATIVDGSFLGAAGDTANELSTWASVSPTALDVPAVGTMQAAVTVTVPRDAAPGEQYGVVWAEARSAPSDSGITQVSRVGIRFYLSIGPGNAPRADFTITSLTAMRSADGNPGVLATVQNTGGRALDLHGTLQLRVGPGSLSAGPFPARLGTTLAVGGTEQVMIALDKQLPAGPWQADITLRSGLVERSTTAIITFPAAGTAPAVQPVPAPARPDWRYPLIAGLGLLLLGIAIALMMLRGRRRHATERDLQRAVPARTAQPRTAEPQLSQVEPTEPQPEQRHANSPSRAPHLSQPITVADIIDAPNHWQLALPNAQDPLTDLANRSLFEDEVQYAFNNSNAEGLCLMMISVDRAVDTSGREGNDALVITMAEALRRVVRPTDLVARFDDEIFAVLFENVERAAVDTISRRMLKTVQESLSATEHSTAARTTIGVAQAQSTDNADLLIQHASAALSEANARAEIDYAWYCEPVGPTVN